MPDLTEESFDRLVRPDSGLWLVDFWAEWCAPCHALAATVAEIAESKNCGADISPPLMADHAALTAIRIGKVDVSANPGLAHRFAIKSLPTIVFFRDGMVVRRLFGAKTRRQLLMAIADISAPPSAG